MSEYEMYDDTKKGGCCRRRCGCFLLVLVLIIVLLVGGTFGAALVGYNSFVRPHTDISLFQAISIIRGLYQYDESRIVTHGFDGDAELENFTRAFWNAFGFDEPLEDISLAMMLQGNAFFAYDTLELWEDFGENSQFMSPGTVAETPDDFNPNNFAPEELPDITAARPDKPEITEAHRPLPDFFTTPEHITITGRTMAAITQYYFSNLSENVANLERVESALRGTEIPRVVQIKQVLIKNTGEVEGDLEMEFTLRFNIGDTLTGMSGGEGVFNTAANMLPSHLFLRVTVFPGNPLRPGRILANEFNANQTAALNQLLNHVARDVGGLDFMLIYLNAAVSEILGSLERYFVPLRFEAVAPS